jgi:PhzF family phenazine biosynthesis protein
MAVQIYQVDAFTNKAFSGNPAGVCLLTAPADERWMQNIAAEMNLAETAFLHPENDGYRLRWFTPTIEEELCGHATLASAHILWQKGILKDGQEVRFFSRSGMLTAMRSGDWIMLDFPAEPPQPVLPPKELSDCLPSLGLLYIGRNRLDYLVEIEDEASLRSFNPDFNLMAKLPRRGIIVTSKSTTAPYDFISRFFAPHDGIEEDPVTGSAHCCLGPYWAGRLGKLEMIAYQASRRGGELRVEVHGQRVHIWGQAVTVLQGEVIDDQA